MEELIGIGLTGVFFLFFLIAMAPWLLFLWTCHKAFDAVREEYREMEPTHVWLNAIPVLNWVWIFLTVSRLSIGLRREASSLNIPIGDAARTIGILFPILFIVGTVTSFVGIGFLFWLAAMILWVIYWIQLSNILSQLQDAQAGRGRSSEAVSSG